MFFVVCRGAFPQLVRRCHQVEPRKSGSCAWSAMVFGWLVFVGWPLGARTSVLLEWPMLLISPVSGFVAVADRCTYRKRMGCHKKCSCFFILSCVSLLFTALHFNLRIKYPWPGYKNSLNISYSSLVWKEAVAQWGLIMTEVKIMWPVRSNLCWGKKKKKPHNISVKALGNIQ